MSSQLESQTPTDPPWPPPWARSIAFFAGLTLMAFEATVEHSKHVAVYGLAFMLTGLPIARGLDKLIDLLSAWRGK